MISLRNRSKSEKSYKTLPLKKTIKPSITVNKQEADIDVETCDINMVQKRKSSGRKKSGKAFT